MKKFIVPVDFSETSLNAARFAAGFCNNIADAEITIYNVFDDIDAGSDGTPLEQDDKGRKAVMELVLNSVKADMERFTNVTIKIVAEEDDRFVDSLERYVRHNNIDVIIMGITGATRLSQIVMGSNTLKIIRRKIAPVIIVPPEAQYTALKNVLLITDLKDVSKTIPAEPLKKMLTFLNADLQVLNVNSEHYIEPTTEYKEELEKLNSIIRDYNPEYSLMRQFDFLDAINQFVKDKNIDIVLTIPKNDSVISNFFKTTNTSKLAYHSHVPIMAIHS